MRVSLTCPDLDRSKVKPMGEYLPVDGSREEFPCCPAAFLRTAGDVEMLRARNGGSPFAEHLIDGSMHVGMLVSETAFEIENGARNVDTVSPKMSEGVHLWFREKSARDEYERQQRKDRH